MPTKEPKHFEIPIVADIPAQSMEVIVGNDTYDITALWNDVSETWSIDISNDNKTINLAGIVLRCGIDLLEPYCIDDCELYLVKNTQTAGNLTLSNIGTDYSLIFRIYTKES